MQWQGSIEFKRAITLNGKPHGVVYYQTTPELANVNQGQVIYVEDIDVLYYRGLSQFIELTPSSTTHNHDDRYYTETEINSMFNTSTGHDHDGVDSKLVSYSNLEDVPSDFLATVHDNSRHSASYLTKENVTYSMLDGNSLLGTGSSQIAIGNHNHDLIYTKQSDLVAYTGASLIGVDNILSQSTLNNALTEIVTKFDDYRLASESYTKSEIESNYYTQTTIDSNIYTKTQIDNDFYTKADVYTKADLSNDGSSEVSWQNLVSLPSTFPPSSHNHDDVYYTKATSDSTFAETAHTHDDRYYTETEMNTTLNSYYTKSQLSTSNAGTVSLNWDNITNTPNYLTEELKYNVVITDSDTEEYGFGVSFSDSVDEIIYDKSEELFKIKRTSNEGSTYEYLAVRDDAMTTGAICYWDDTEKQIKTSTATISGSTISGNISWTNVTSKPTTLSGYGITDAASSTHTHLYAGSSTAGGAATSASGVVSTNSSGSSTKIYISGTTSTTSAAPMYCSSMYFVPSSGQLIAPEFVGSFTGNASTASAWDGSITLSLTGAVTGSASIDGSGNVSLATTLANSGVTAETYKSVTVNTKGLVTGGTNPTTLAGYGITDTYTKTEVVNIVNNLIDQINDLIIYSSTSNAESTSLSIRNAAFSETPISHIS